MRKYIAILPALFLLSGICNAQQCYDTVHLSGVYITRYFKHEIQPERNDPPNVKVYASPVDYHKVEMFVPLDSITTDQPLHKWLVNMDKKRPYLFSIDSHDLLFVLLRNCKQGLATKALGQEVDSSASLSFFEVPSAHGDYIYKLTIVQGDWIRTTLKIDSLSHYFIKRKESYNLSSANGRFECYALYRAIITSNLKPILDDDVKPWNFDVKHEVAKSKKVLYEALMNFN
jgi:hypothetical protein